MFKLIGVLLAIAALLGGGLYLYQRNVEQAAAEALAKSEEAAVKVVTGLRNNVVKTIEPLEALATRAGLAQSLTGTPDERAEVERAIADVGAGQHLLKARLLPLGVDHAEYGDRTGDAGAEAAGAETGEATKAPPFDYAGLAMLRSSLEREADPPIELHRFGLPGAHIAMMRRILDADGALAGHLLLQFDFALLDGVVDGVAAGDGFVALNQRRAMLASAGNKAAREGLPLQARPVAGTAWRVQYWAPPVAVAQIELPLELIGAAGGAVVLVLAVVGVMVAKRRRAAAKAVQPTAPSSEVPASSTDVGEPEPAEADAGAIAASQPPTESGASELSASDTSSQAGDEAQAGAGALDMPESIFRAYDVRGVVGETLTPDIVRAIGRAIGSEAHDRGQNTVIVACDGRHSGPELKQALTEGLLSTGRDVIDIGRVPTPILYFATYFLNTGSGVMVTGSHNPPNYNGMKIMLGGETLFGEDIARLRHRVVNNELIDGSGNAREMEVMDEYIRRISEDIPVALGRSFRVVVDCGNGVAGEAAPKMLRALGHDVAELFCEIDGSFPNHHPDPSQPENMADLIAAVKGMKADVGFAFDGDGDRLGVVDANGEIIWPDRQMILFSKAVLEGVPGGEIIYDVKCSSRLTAAIEEYGGKPVMWKTGHSFIKNKLKESGAPLAGEMSGHIFFNDRWYGFDDAIYSAARMLEIMLNSSAKPDELFAALPEGHSTPELKLDMEEGQNHPFMERLMQADGLGDGRLTTIDGVRVDWPDGWGLVRASNTTPSLVIRFEGDTEEALKRIKEQFRKVLLGLDGSLKLPF